VKAHRGPHHNVRKLGDRQRPVPFFVQFAPGVDSPDEGLLHFAEPVYFPPGSILHDNFETLAGDAQCRLNGAL